MLLVSGYRLVAGAPLERRPGVLAPDAPLQHEVGAVEPWMRDEFTIRPRARIEATVRVLGREAYRFDALATVVPLDLAVGWGPMSDSAILDALDLSQSARFLTWRAERFPIPEPEINRHAANWHVLPADDRVRRTLARLRVGELVHVRGLLVDLDSPATGRVSTSLSREDRGAGACEIVWVEEVEIR